MNFCTLEDCQREHRALGFCNPHYLMFKRYGDPEYSRPLLNSGLCSVGCERDAVKRGMCAPHARRLRLYGDPHGKPERKQVPAKLCTVDGCSKPFMSRDMCNMHYSRMLRTGTTEPRGGRAECTVDECLRPHRAHGYCGLHLQRYYKHGDPGPAYLRKASENRTRDGSGYVMINVNRRRTAEHRYVMEQVIGRELRGDENVHHINGVRDDNRPENLELWTTYQPAGQRASDQVEWAREILRRYA